MVVYSDAHPLQPGLECLGSGVVMVAGEHHTGDIEAEVPEDLDQPDHVQVIGDAQVTPDLVLLNICGVDGDDHLHLIL